MKKLVLLCLLLVSSYVSYSQFLPAEIYGDTTSTISFGEPYTWICTFETLEKHRNDDTFEIIQVSSYEDTIFTEHRSEITSSSVTEYFVEARPETNDITHIFVFEGVKRIIAYSEGFKNVFNLRYTEFPWSRPGEVVLQTMFCDFRLVVDADQGHIFCDDLVWKVYNIEYYGDRK